MRTFRVQWKHQCRCLPIAKTEHDRAMLPPWHIPQLTFSKERHPSRWNIHGCKENRGVCLALCVRAFFPLMDQVFLKHTQHARELWQLIANALCTQSRVKPQLPLFHASHRPLSADVPLLRDLLHPHKPLHSHQNHPRKTLLRVRAFNATSFMPIESLRTPAVSESGSWSHRWFSLAYW